MKILKGIAVLTALAGAAFLAKGLWIPAKAVLAHGLMDRAYARTSISNVPQKPWPSADFGVIAKLRIANSTLHVLDRATSQAMAFGAGRHEEYDPDTGPLVLSGHRDTYFAVLEHLLPGDPVIYQTRRGDRYYRVSETRIYDIREGVIQPPGPNQILLMTCWPFNAIDPDTPKRFLVLAEAASLQEPANP